VSENVVQHLLIFVFAQFPDRLFAKQIYFAQFFQDVVFDLVTRWEIPNVKYFGCIAFGELA